MRTVGIRQFSRNVYTELKDLPVTLTRKGKPFCVIEAHILEVVRPEIKKAVDILLEAENSFDATTPEDLQHTNMTYGNGLGNSDQLEPLTEVTTQIRPIPDEERIENTSAILDIHSSPNTFETPEQASQEFDQELSDARTNGWTEKLKKKIFG